jgi:hypothetical protein
MKLTDEEREIALEIMLDTALDAFSDLSDDMVIADPDGVCVTIVRAL